MFKKQEYKILYKRIIFTCFILIIYILGSNISIVGSSGVREDNDTFFKLAISNVGGDLTTLNIFSLGLGPWLTSMVIIMLLNYRNVDKMAKQTRSEKHYKERIITILFATFQSYYVINTYIHNNFIKNANIILLMLILITGTMFLVWLADQNITYGIAGPMPIVLMSLIKSLFHNQHFTKLNISTTLLVLVVLTLIIALFFLLFIELTEYRLDYKDIMNNSTEKTPTYLAWKLNPAGSISIMISLSAFVILSNLIHFIVTTIDENIDLGFLSFANPIGITCYFILQIFLNYLLSRFLINTKKKSKEFLKNGNYFDSVQPGKETERYLNKKARRVCLTGAMIVACILAIPMYSTLFIPNMSKEIYFSMQLIILVYISINIGETIRTYLYFDRYKQILNKYW
ncbi:accessory Sec system protein translocase subunit SecY2 [Staphylococcus croceilyticus]|uniref:Accessory Sec system protein translocase subunit SecY2 n=1 Tax=Staphylococcus croceilyticus TaxID=319942 RepID=A0ABY2KG77_9STAP|nr:accessory Sec system protein translocase subunit SecY2 [Staphylococcus croceilyticus]PNZ67033.1 accessory Sec system protein translocase subunit SecY2 [Staphylococcus croceilyticus]TGA81073.1 accessory Sec system protein translocase subunit SecY2 [Staphylococcus croceilyticus]